MSPKPVPSKAVGSRTARQVLGAMGESLVASSCRCPRCKRGSSLKKLPLNFKCADVICDFCGYLAQVKATSVRDLNIPDSVMGAAWGPQRDRMASGIYFPLFLVLVVAETRQTRILYLSADAQQPEMFVVREPLSVTARRAGWQGFIYDLRAVKPSFIEVKPISDPIIVPRRQRGRSVEGRPTSQTSPPGSPA